MNVEEARRAARDVCPPSFTLEERAELIAAAEAAARADLDVPKAIADAFVDIETRVES